MPLCSVHFDEPVTGHLMADSAASKPAGANDEHADHAADAALAMKIFALNHTVMDLTEELTRQNIRCEFVHHQLGLLPKLSLSSQVAQLGLLIDRMRGMTQQNSKSLAQPQFGYPANPDPDHVAPVADEGGSSEAAAAGLAELQKRRRVATYLEGSAVCNMPAHDRYSAFKAMSLDETLQCRPDLEKVAAFMLDVIREYSSRGKRATQQELRLKWGTRVPALDSYFTQGLFSMKKLLDAAHPAVAESGRHPKKIKTMQDLWNRCPKLKDASLFMADLVKKNPKVKKTEILREWAE
jgi:hypothetical protein